MYEYLEGSLSGLTPTNAVIDCNGVGYLTNISLNTFTKLQGQARVKLFVHLAIREDAHVLYGFADESEREVFRQLITVSGVGANTARLILSSLGPGEVAEAIVHENVKVLQGIKGIGAKSAQRIIVDLKDKLAKYSGTKEISGFLHNTSREEALSALVMLGFNKTIAEKTIDHIQKNEGTSIPVEHLIKQALKML
jgi:holliday junction DNA helicase RuvA